MYLYLKNNNTGGKTAKGIKKKLVLRKRIV